MPTVAMRVTRRRRKFMHSAKVKRQLAAVLDDTVKPHFIKSFERVVCNWKHKPEFKGRKFIRPNKMWVDIFAAGEHKKIWIFVTKGTRAHIIRAKRGKTLAFQWGGKGSYKPKTKPPGKFGGPGVVVGGEMHFPKQVKHPGSKAREFEKVIAKDEKPWFSRTMENAWRRIIRAL